MLPLSTQQIGTWAQSAIWSASTCDTSDVADRSGRDLGEVFDEVPDLYDRVRPAYPDDLFADLASITAVGVGSSVLEVGCGTGAGVCTSRLRSGISWLLEA